MSINNIYDSSFSLLERNLDLRLQKHNLLTSNIANMDTPNYRPFDFVLEEAFDEFNQNGNRLEIRKSNTLHLTNQEDPKNTQPGSRKYDDAVKLKEEEKVDLDKSMSNLSENTLLYNASVQILSKKYNMIKQSITGGAR